MPYQDERASRLGHLDLSTNADIAAEIGQYYLPTVEERPAGLADITHAAPEGAAGPIRFAIAVDGSLQEIPVRDDYPSAHLGFLQVGAVWCDLDKMLHQGGDELVDPRALAAATDRLKTTTVVPSTVLRYREGLSAGDSWREKVRDFFTQTRWDDGDAGFSMQDLLYVLAGSHANPAQHVTVGRCPEKINGCDGKDIQVPAGGTGCPTCGVEIHPTDVLRIHDDVVEEGSNREALGRLMSVAETLCLVAQVEIFWRRRDVDASFAPTAADTAFILDGPLAVFGPSAGLKRQLGHYFARFQRDLLRTTGAAPVIVGLEKTGQFADHARQLGRHMTPRTLVCPDDTYIRRWVAPGKRDSKPYGEDTFYGRRMFYKAADGSMHILSLVPADGNKAYSADETAGDLRRFPALSRACQLLDQIGTKMYENAVIPVALAHNFVAIPVGTGSDVLRMLGQRQLGLGPNASTSRPILPR